MSGMTEEQRFLFDLQGYLLVPNVLPKEQVERMRTHMEEHGIKDPKNNPNDSRFGNFLSWGAEWRELIDHPKLFPLLVELLGDNFRLDHAYGMAASAKAAPEAHGLHHHADMFSYGCFYVANGQRIHNGLIVVSFALTDIEPGVGGFCCIPGSHKSQFKMPDKWYGLADNPLVRQVPQQAGDVVIFTESLTHGTWPWTKQTGERRSVLLKYCPGYMQWSQKPMNAALEGLTERQQAIMKGAYVWQRPRVTE
ncbi:MAG: hypothetical protein AMXMBFR7_00020 [Planctomycetota bacterium]